MAGQLEVDVVPWGVDERTLTADPPVVASSGHQPPPIAEERDAEVLRDDAEIAPRVEPQRW